MVPLGSRVWTEPQDHNFPLTTAAPTSGATSANGRIDHSGDATTTSTCSHAFPENVREGVARKSLG